MRFLISSIGSSGDLHPYVGIGAALRARGHEVALLAQPYFQRVAEDAGLEFIPVGEFMDLRDIARRPELMATYAGTKRILQDLVIPEAPLYFRALEDQFRQRRTDAVLTHHICFGSRWACQKHGVPAAVGCLAPLAWPCIEDPAHFVALIRRDPSPRAMKWWLRVARFGSRIFYDPPLNRHRRALGLAKGSNWMLEEARAGTITLALWSRHFRAPLPADPPHGHVCGFVWFDRHRQREHPGDQIERFLDTGEPPIIFTLGSTAVHVAGSFYQAAADACRLLNRRGLLLTGQPEYAPRSLPPGVAAFSYAPYSTVLPRAAAIVHHGGIGTTAQALRAGRPTVIVPFAHDQFDNAARAHRLGVSVTVRRAHISAGSLAAALRTVLDDPTYRAKAADVGRRLATEDGAQVAADHLEALASQTSSRPPELSISANLT